METVKQMKQKQFISGQPYTIQKPKMTFLNDTNTFQTKKILRSLLNELLESKKGAEIYRICTEHSLNGFAIFQNRRITFVNKVFSDISGYSIPALQNMTPKDIFSLIFKEDRAATIKYIDDLLSEKLLPAPKSFRIIHKDSHIRWIESLMTPTIFQGNLSLLISINDITKQKWSEEAAKNSVKDIEKLVTQRTRELTKEIAHLKKENAKLKRTELNRKINESKLKYNYIQMKRSNGQHALGQIAASMAHELNQPLVGIRGLAEHHLICLDRKWDFSEEDLTESLKLIIEQADKMYHITEHVRQFVNKPRNADEQLVNANKVIQSTVKLLITQFRNRGIELKLDLDKNISQVLVNPYSLEEVIINLLINARDASEQIMSENKQKIPTEIIIQTCTKNRDADNFIIIKVKDNGCGIPECQIRKVFDPFFTTKNRDTGTGLGLCIAKEFIEGFGGTIDISSEQGKGTTVTITLPAPKEAEK